MELKSMQDFLEIVKKKSVVKNVAVPGAADDHVLEAVFEGEKLGLVKAILIDKEEEVKKVLKEMGKDPANYEIINANTPEECGQIAVNLVREGKANVILKGLIETKDVLKPVVNKETGIGLGGVMSIVAFTELPSYHKLLVVTDGGMMTYPTVEQKAGIIKNAVDCYKKLGIENPKIACVAAVEKVNPKMPETVDAAELKKMNEEGLIKDCIVEGPISLDLAVSADSAARKKYESPVAGDADVILVPNIQVGNVAHKSMLLFGGGKMAGVVIGAKCPIIINSRGSSAEEKFDSLLLACAVAD
ncbi:MAG: phosphate butyryltransferase [Parasporobacterium sp.]|nr:phosphate butyryltransferase [Parasporobacterium sp.]